MTLIFLYSNSRHFSVESYFYFIDNRIIAKIVQIQDCGEDEGFSEIKHYSNENGKISESTKKYKTEKAWGIFDKAVFTIK